MINVSLSKAEAFKLLRFHLGEVAADLSLLRDRLAMFPCNGDGVDWECRDALAGALSVLEHVVDHHLDESQRLMKELLGRDIMPKTQQDQLPPPPRDHTELGKGQRLLSSRIHRCDEEVRRLLMSLENSDSSPATVAEVLGQLLANARDFLYPLASQLHSVVTVLYQMEHPKEAHQEELDQQKSEPRRELEHLQAKTLQNCLYCEAPLSADDRTSDGSFCEVCGTRWILPAQPDALSKDTNSQNEEKQNG